MTTLLDWLRQADKDEADAYPNRVRQLDRYGLHCWALSPTQRVWLKPGEKPKPRPEPDEGVAK